MYMSWVPAAAPPSPTKGEGVVMVMLPPLWDMGWTLDSGGAHRIYRGRTPLMGRCPSFPCGCGVEEHMA